MINVWKTLKVGMYVVHMCFMKEKEHIILICTCERLFFKLPIMAGQNFAPPTYIKTEMTVLSETTLKVKNLSIFRLFFVLTGTNKKKKVDKWVYNRLQVSHCYGYSF